MERDPGPASSGDGLGLDGEQMVLPWGPFSHCCSKNSRSPCPWLSSLLLALCSTNRASTLWGLLLGSRVVERRDLSGPGGCLVLWGKSVRDSGVRTSPPPASALSGVPCTETHGGHCTSHHLITSVNFRSSPLSVIALLNRNSPTRNCVSLK